ncbi:kinase-like protein, partial [Auricularia subglabra TFB-10046 SS5]
LLRELNRWQPLDHRHILPLYAVCRMRGRLTLVMPFMENGDACHFLQLNPHWDIKKILVETAQAVDYIHNTAGVVHGDIKGANILISATGTALLSDFGLGTTIAAAKDITEPSIRYARTAQFSAPELFADTAANPDEPFRIRSKTTMSDVFAFGALIYELYTGAPPWAGMSDHVIALNLCRGSMPDRRGYTRTGQEITDSLWDLCERCWRSAPMERP